MNLLSCYLLYKSSIRLSVPQPLDSLGNADIVCLERVKGDTHGEGGDAESPVRGSANLGDALLGEVVDDA
jgi:hypothetical protein